VIKNTLISLQPFSNLTVKLNKFKDALFLHTGLVSMIALPPFIPVHSLKNNLDRETIINSIKKIPKNFPGFRKMRIAKPAVIDNLLYIEIEIDELFLYLNEYFDKFGSIPSVVPPNKGFFIGYTDGPLVKIKPEEYGINLPDSFSKCIIGILSITYPLKDIWERVYWNFEPVKKITIGV